MKYLTCEQTQNFAQLLQPIDSLENESSQFFSKGMFSICPHISLLSEGHTVMQSLDLFCSQDILVAA